MGSNSESSVWLRVLSSRLVAPGTGDRFALQNIATQKLDDGALCWVSTGAGKGEWQLDRSATDAPDGTTIIAPDNGPGRWFKKWDTGPGGGTSSIISVAGTNGIVATNPLGPNVSLSGAALYARDGSNGAMTADVNMGTNDLNNAGTGTFAGAVTGLTFNGVALTTGGSATNFLNAQGNYVAVPSGAPGAPVNSVQYNSAGAFAGSAQWLFAPASGGTGPESILKASTATDVATGYIIQNSVGAVVASLGYSDSAIPSSRISTVSGANLFQVDAYSGDLQLKSFDDILLTRGAVTWTWPTADGTSGQALVTNGAGVLSFATITSSAPTVQNIGAAGPTNVTATANTIALVNFAGAAAVVLPAPTNGRLATVKDASGLAGTNNITVTSTSGNIDGSASQVIATNYGSMSFVADGTNWWIV